MEMKKKTSRICPADDDHNSWSPPPPHNHGEHELKRCSQYFQHFGIFTARKRCLQACVCPRGGGAWSEGCLLPGGVPDPWGVPAPGGVPALAGCLLPGVLLRGGACSRGVPALVGGCSGGCLMETPGMATAEGGTHPTGMHSCY